MFHLFSYNNACYTVNNEICTWDVEVIQGGNLNPLFSCVCFLLITAPNQDIHYVWSLPYAPVMDFTEWLCSVVLLSEGIDGEHCALR